MINSLNAYADAGSKAGLAAKHQDWSMVTFQQSWVRRAVALESQEDKAAAQAAYRDAYKAAAGQR